MDLIAATDSCDLIKEVLWNSAVVCLVGWTCFLIAFIFLTVSICFENKRLHKIQNQIIIFRTSTTNDFRQPSSAPTTDAWGAANATYVPTPQPQANNFQLGQPPAQHVYKPVEERASEVPSSSRVFPNSFSYTRTEIPLETQVSYQGQSKPNYNKQNPPPVPPKWNPQLRAYTTNY